MIELRAFLCLLHYSSVPKSNNEDLEASFATAGIGLRGRVKFRMYMLPIYRKRKRREAVVERKSKILKTYASCTAIDEAHIRNTSSMEVVDELRGRGLTYFADSFNLRPDRGTPDVEHALAVRAGERLLHLLQARDTYPDRTNRIISTMKLSWLLTIGMDTGLRSVLESRNKMLDKVNNGNGFPGRIHFPDEPDGLINK
ncbi:hypothetical protein Trydic_g19620 [Trypoxylus dichotomus]